MNSSPVESFETFSPKLHLYYRETLQTLQTCYPDFDPPFPEAPVFGMASCNFRKAATYPHRDYGNLAWGWCSITALGDFDPDMGGHLVLWESSLVVRFPPGSTILIPSSIITHSNTSINAGGVRHSLVLYSAAGLFQWVYNRFRTDAQADNDSTQGEKQKRKADQKGRWEQGLNIWSTLEEWKGL